MPNSDFKEVLVSYDKQTNILTPVLLNVLNLLQKSNKMLDKAHILSLTPTRLINEQAGQCGSSLFRNLYIMVLDI